MLGWLVGWLGINGNFSTNRRHHANSCIQHSTRQSLYVTIQQSHQQWYTLQLVVKFSININKIFSSTLRSFFIKHRTEMNCRRLHTHRIKSEISNNILMRKLKSSLIDILQFLFLFLSMCCLFVHLPVQVWQWVILNTDIFTDNTDFLYMRHLTLHFLCAFAVDVHNTRCLIFDFSEGISVNVLSKLINDWPTEWLIKTL